MRRGATDYLLKGAESEDLVLALKRILDRRNLLQRQEQQNFEVASIQKQHQLIGESKPMVELRKIIARVRNTSANILITGETGTGKEVVARLLRRSLESSLEPFVAVDSATIQSSTAESSLFGHEKGAFTGADRTTKGIFEEADGGTVYFDEISNMSLGIQSKLLRVLQEREISRLGSSRVKKLEFRVICASNRNLEEMVGNHEFKPDLFQRLNVIPISLCPLRERTEDIPELIDYFVLKKKIDSRIRFKPSAIEALQAYSWPGNVRELENLITYLITMTDSKIIKLQDLPLKFQQNIKDLTPKSQTFFPLNTMTEPSYLESYLKPSCAESPTIESSSTESSYFEKVRRYEKALLLSEYHRHKGNISRLAKSIKMNRSHLYLKLKEFEIHSAKLQSMTQYKTKRQNPKD